MGFAKADPGPAPLICINKQCLHYVYYSSPRFEIPGSATVSDSLTTDVLFLNSLITLQYPNPIPS